ncbi:MAG: hypothetical protein ACI9MC_003355 [Kiritimatiellia bacterium]|jgi:hypothetical protein
MMAFIVLGTVTLLALVVAIVAGVALLMGLRVPPLAVAAALGLPLAITHTMISRAVGLIDADRGTVLSSMTDGLAEATQAAELAMWVGLLTVVPGLVFLMFAAITGARAGPRHFAAPLLAVPLTLTPALIALFAAYQTGLSSSVTLVTSGLIGLVGLLSALAMLRGGDGNGRHAGAAAGMVAALCICALFLGMNQFSVFTMKAMMQSAPPELHAIFFQSAASIVLAWQNTLMLASVAAVGFALLGASCMAGESRADRWQGLLLAAISLLFLPIAPTTSTIQALHSSTNRARVQATPTWTQDLQAPTLNVQRYNSTAAELIVLDAKSLRFHDVDLVLLTGTPPTLPDSAIVDSVVKPLAIATSSVNEPVSLAVHAQTEGRALAAVALTLARKGPVRVYTSANSQITLHPVVRTPLYAELTPQGIAKIPCDPTPCSGASFPYDDWRTLIERGQQAHRGERNVAIYVHPGVTAEAALAAAMVADRMELRVTLVPRSPQ